MKNKLCLTASVIMTIFTVFIFMPVIYTKQRWEADVPGIGAYTKNGKVNIGVNLFELNMIFSILIILFALASIVVLILQFAKNKNKLLDKLTFIPVVTFFIFTVASICRFNFSKPIGDPEGTATLGKHGFFSYIPNWGFYIAIALVLIVAVISFLIAIGKVKDDNKTKISNQTEHLSNADELKKFKELLDSGIITQEEFDAKKKQLLGL